MYFIYLITWFWFRLSSIAWHVPMESGISVILFFDKFTASRFLRVLIDSGNCVSLFSDTFSVLKLDNCDKDSGRLVKWFQSRDKCSSPFRFPISFGMISKGKKNIFLKTKILSLSFLIDFHLLYFEHLDFKMSVTLYDIILYYVFGSELSHVCLHMPWISLIG